MKRKSKARRFPYQIYALCKELIWTLFQTEVVNNFRKFRCAVGNGFSLR